MIRPFAVAASTTSIQVTLKLYSASQSPPEVKNKTPRPYPYDKILKKDWGESQETADVQMVQGELFEKPALELCSIPAKYTLTFTPS